MKAIGAASKHGRLDLFIQSTDKNFLVPVGGALVATCSKELGRPLLKQAGCAHLTRTRTFTLTRTRTRTPALTLSLAPTLNLAL